MLLNESGEVLVEIEEVTIKKLGEQAFGSREETPVLVELAALVQDGLQEQRRLPDRGRDR